VRTLHLVPQGRLKVARDVVLGSDKQAGQSREGRLNTGAEFSAVPCGTVRSRVPNPGLRPGLLSDVPAGLNAEFSRILFSPCAFVHWNFVRILRRQGLKALTILAGSGTTEVVP
jgi:hypothetical protein